MGRASSQCLVAGLLTVARTLGKVARLSQFAGPLEVAVTLKQVYLAPRVFGSVSSKACASPVRATVGGAWLQCPPLNLPLRWLEPQVVPVLGPQVVVGHTHHWNLRWLWWFAPTACRPCKNALLYLAHAGGAVTHSLHKRGPLLHPPGVCTHAEKNIPIVVHHSFSWLPQQQHLASPAGPDLLLGFLSCGTLLPALDALLPGPSYWPPEPESQCPAPFQASQAVVSWEVVLIVCEALSLLCPPQSSCCDFLWGFEVPPSYLISLSVRWLPRLWVPFLFRSSLSGVLVLSWLFPFCSTHLCGGFLALYGGLRSSATIQYMFHVNHSTCRWGFLWCVCGIWWAPQLIPPPSWSCLPRARF